MDVPDGAARTEPSGIALGSGELQTPEEFAPDVLVEIRADLVLEDLMWQQESHVPHSFPISGYTRAQNIIEGTRNGPANRGISSPNVARYRRMPAPVTADEDPEQRIAELERPLLQSAADSEAITGSPRVGLRLGWIALGLLVAGLVVGGGAILAGRSATPVSGRPTMIGGGGTVAENPTTPTLSQRPTGTGIAPPLAPPSSAAPVPTTPSGQAVSVAGVGNERTIACTDNVVSISGVDNKVVLTGHCSRVDVSGLKNVVTIDSADAIVVSGMNNAVVFHSGTPELDNSGLDNTLGRG
jgi:hypothetical protein